MPKVNLATLLNAKKIIPHYIRVRDALIDSKLDSESSCENKDLSIKSDPIGGGAMIN